MASYLFILLYLLFFLLALTFFPYISLPQPRKLLVGNSFFLCILLCDSK
jgi:hypothetical protein